MVCVVVWCDVVWCGAAWCAVVWCGVVWCGVVRRGVVCGGVRMVCVCGVGGVYVWCVRMSKDTMIRNWVVCQLFVKFFFKFILFR